MQGVVVTQRFQFTMSKEVGEAYIDGRYYVALNYIAEVRFSARVGGGLVVKVVDGRAVMEPDRALDALKRLATIADKYLGYLGGSKNIDAVKLVEGSLERETGLH